MVILIIIVQLLFGIWSGYTAANEGEFEHVTVAILFNIAVVISLFASFFGEVYHFFIAQFLWALIAFVTSEIVGLLGLINNDE